VPRAARGGDHPTGRKGDVRQFEGVEGNVDRSCTGLCGCWGHSGNKGDVGGVLQK
jgi:hypothetical protein